jgi:cysteine synthase B
MSTTWRSAPARATDGTGISPERSAGSLSLLHGVGHTPLVEIDLVREVAPHARLLAKLEACNPGGSIKDRPVSRMLVRGLREGRLAGGRRLLDSSSGNAGIAYAMLGAALGAPGTLVTLLSDTGERYSSTSMWSPAETAGSAGGET